MHLLPEGVERVEGAPNFRQVNGFPVFGVGQPTEDGFLAILNKVQRENRLFLEKLAKHRRCMNQNTNQSVQAAGQGFQKIYHILRWKFESVTNQRIYLEMLKPI